MNSIEAMEVRHSVRAYEDRSIEAETAAKLQAWIEKCNAESGLHIQLVLNEPKAFDGFMAHYGKFSGVSSYVALIGKKSKGLDEKIGYYGEKIALYAQTLGLNSCWVAMTYKKIKSAFVVDKDEKLRMVIALGYGKTQGVAHKNKPVEKVARVRADSPAWFANGVQAALLAPTAMNQQKFFFEETDGVVKATSGTGFYTRVDLGIAKYHFGLGAGAENFTWQNE